MHKGCGHTATEHAEMIRTSLSRLGPTIVAATEAMAALVAELRRELEEEP
jgi:hypothetical protein